MVKASEKEIAIVRAALEKGSFSAERIADVVSELANFKTVNIAEWPEDLASCILGLAREYNLRQQAMYIKFYTQNGTIQRD